MLEVRGWGWKGEENDFDDCFCGQTSTPLLGWMCLKARRTALRVDLHI